MIKGYKVMRIGSGGGNLSVIEILYCTFCGSLIVDEKIHDKWHAAVYNAFDSSYESLRKG